MRFVRRQGQPVASYPTIFFVFPCLVI